MTKILKTKDNCKNVTLSVTNNGWRPHDAFVLDVCETDKGMRVVEINTLNSAGFYACDIAQLVLALDNKFNIEN